MKYTIVILADREVSREIKEKESVMTVYKAVKEIDTLDNITEIAVPIAKTAF